MMRVAAGEQLQVQADAGVQCDGFHDVANERAGEMSADHAVFEAFRLSGAHHVRTAGDVNNGLGERLVQRNSGIGEPADATLVAERLTQGLAEDDCGVFDRVMHVDVGVAARLDVQVDKRMFAERGHHMVVEGHRRVDLGFARAIKVQ